MRHFGILLVEIGRGWLNQASMADDPNLRKFYVSWVDRRKDPWPRWLERVDGPNRKGKVIAVRPAEDGKWPGVAENVEPGHPWQYLGPTLTALFHPRSPYHNFTNLHRVYLLYEPELSERSPHDKLATVMQRLCAARNLGELAKRVVWVPIAGIADHTDHKQIVQRLEEWIHGDQDPFNLRRKSGKNPPSITINLTPGTPAKHSCWLMLHWKGALGNPPHAFVKFIQGDSGAYADEETRVPIRDVPIDVLSRFIGKETPAAAPATAQPPEWVRLEDLKSEPYEKLRQIIEQTALLGIPIVLHGERGTGKTFLARHYHERRQFYRRQQGSPVEFPTRKGRGSTLRFPSNAPKNADEVQFVPVTLSEYADLSELRDNLFGWAEGSWTGAKGEYHGLLGQAHGGTLFFDEIHHLDRTLQASLLGVLNNRRYRPKMAPYELESHFDLVVATNDAQWRTALADDFRDRIERVVLEVPSFRSLQRHDDLADLWSFWEFTLQRRCREAGIAATEMPEDCRAILMGALKHQPLLGNWRDLMRLADQALLLLTAARGGRPTDLTWNKDLLDKAIFQTFRATRE
jgi:hypothetical protein